MNPDNRRVDSIAIVGGGDAGLLTALALEKATENVEIVVIDDFEQGVPEVGKSTLTFLAHFLHNLIEIDAGRMISEVKLAWKTSVYFEDWCGDEFHSPLGKPLPTVRQIDRGDAIESRVGGDTLSQKNEKEFQELYYRHKQDNFSTMYREVAETPGKTPMIIDRGDAFGVQKGLPDSSYHFSSRSLNAFLRTICRERDVELVDDRISEVVTVDGWIDHIESDVERYDADLYVDASGFKRLLMDELDNSFDQFDLPVDSAAVATVDIDLSEVVSATVVTTGTAGWFWQIDTYDVRDLGYVYSSDHISDEAAVQEFIETRDEEIDPDEVRHYRFDSGVLEEPWLNNCVAIGNALGFVEPLQSTALTTSAMLAYRLSRFLGKHGRVNHEGLRQLYNDTTLATWEEVYNFISLYYKYSSGTTQFWEDARSINPGKTQEYVSYQQSGFGGIEERSSLTRTDADLNPYYLYCLILRNLGVNSEFFENIDIDVDPAVIKRVEEHSSSVSEQMNQYLSYREFYHSFHPGFE
jgi:tryptophan halogenase